VRRKEDEICEEAAYRAHDEIRDRDERAPLADADRDSLSALEWLCERLGNYRFKRGRLN
jgi:hypothetical protein